MPDSLPNVFVEPDSFQASYTCEYLVVGTGPGASTAGELLAKNGKDVIFIEEGPFVRQETCTPHNIGEMTSRLYRNKGISPFLGSPPIAFVEGCCVGGGSFINGALLWRTPRWILDEWKTEYGLRGYGADDLAQHFERIETRLNVIKHTKAHDGNLDSLALAKGADALGWKYVMAPRAVKNCKNNNLCPTGCPSHAKQDMLSTYLPRALNNGARMFAGLKATHIGRGAGKAVNVVARTTNTPETKTTTFSFDKLILAAGAIQTPHLLRRSSCSKTAGKNIEFHMNLKIVARFREPVNAQNGTIFTVQVQQFEREGTVFMASNMRPNYLAMTLADFRNEHIARALEDYPYYGIYVAMIKPRSKAHIVSFLGGQPLVRYRLDPADALLIKRALRQAAKLLFASGATELYMPISRSKPVKTLEELDRELQDVPARRFVIISVHAMASCPMGNRHSVVEQDGRLKGFDNIYITDASILPSNIGESPQGTIMAFASRIISGHLS